MESSKRNDANTSFKFLNYFLYIPLLKKKIIINNVKRKDSYSKEVPVLKN